MTLIPCLRVAYLAIIIVRARRSRGLTHLPLPVLLQRVPEPHDRMGDMLWKTGEIS